MERAGHVYSRITNPTNAVFEERMAALEGGVAGIAGRECCRFAFRFDDDCRSRLAYRGVSCALYGGFIICCPATLKRFGIETSFVDPRDLDVWRNAIRPNTKVLFAETLGNPGLMS